MKKPILVTSVLDILQENKWKEFCSDFAFRLSKHEDLDDKEFKMVCIFSSPEVIKSTLKDLNQVAMETVEIIMITMEKICKIILTTQETAILWSESSQEGSPKKENGV